MKKTLTKIMPAKQLLKTLAVVLCLIVAVSCKKTVEPVETDPLIINPITDYQVVKDATDPFKFTFKNLSSKYKKIEWRFGDDSLSTETAPTHIYLLTGKFTVDVKTYSETGNTSHKTFDIVISPNDVATITLLPTSANRVQFGLTSNVTLASATWTFSDTTANKFNSLNPLKTFTVGSFNTATATVKTVNGSVATVSLAAITSVGLVKNITAEQLRYTVSAENTYAAAENSTKLMDGDLSTKYTMGSTAGRQFTFPFTLTVFYATPRKVLMYGISNTDNLPNRDMKAWTIQGSNDGVTWTILDTRLMVKTFYDQMTAILPAGSGDALKYKQLFYFAVANPGFYTQYRWVITDCWDTANPKIMATNDFRLLTAAQ